jgi:hypothetical protein
MRSLSIKSQSHLGALPVVHLAMSQMVTLRSGSVYKILLFSPNANPKLERKPMNIRELKQICEDAEAFRNQAWLNIQLPNGHDISFKVKDIDERYKLMHACRRAGVDAWYATLAGATKNVDHAGRKEPFWGIK